MALKLAKTRRNPLYCSFCGKTDDEVGYLVSGPTVFICNECVELCRETGHEILTKKAALDANNVVQLKP